MITASHQTFSGQIKYLSSQTKFGQTNLLYNISVKISLSLLKTMNVQTINSLYHKHRSTFKYCVCICACVHVCDISAYSGIAILRVIQANMGGNICICIEGKNIIMSQQFWGNFTPNSSEINTGLCTA